MFLKEALLRCSQLEDEVASVYDELTRSPAATPEVSASWSEASHAGRQRARLLRALAELSTALEDDGPFLVQVPVQIAAVRRALENAHRRLPAVVDSPSGQRCVEALEAAPRRDLYAGLLEVAEPELKRAMRLVDAEVKSLRRNGNCSRPRDVVRARVLCPQPAG